jgi:hypothetical protein
MVRKIWLATRTTVSKLKNIFLNYICFGCLEGDMVRTPRAEGGVAKAGKLPQEASHLCRASRKQRKINRTCYKLFLND